jgi:hypothetical protein
MWVNRKNVRSPPSGSFGIRRGLRELISRIVVERGVVDEIDIDSGTAQLEGDGISILDQKRYTEQGLRRPLTASGRYRIKRSKAQNARDPLLPVPLEITQTSQCSFQVARLLRHPVVRVSRLHPLIELVKTDV